MPGSAERVDAADEDGWRDEAHPEGCAQDPQEVHHYLDGLEPRRPDREVQRGLHVAELVTATEAELVMGHGLVEVG